MLGQPQTASHGMPNAVWDGFKMVDKQLSYNWSFSTQQSVYMAFNVNKKKYKSWCYTIKKNILENIALFISFKNIHISK